MKQVREEVEEEEEYEEQRRLFSSFPDLFHPSPLSIWFLEFPGGRRLDVGLVGVPFSDVWQSVVFYGIYWLVTWFLLSPVTDYYFQLQYTVNDDKD